MEYFAHTRIGADGTVACQTAKEHCRNVAALAASSLKSVGLGQTAYLAGILHDMGKFKADFQDYLLKGVGQRGSVIHTFAGVKYLLDTYRKSHTAEDGGDDEEDILSELAAYAVGAHHGLFDIEPLSGGENGFLHRKYARGIGFEESRDAFFKDCMDASRLNAIVGCAASELGRWIDSLWDMPAPEGGASDTEISFFMGLTERLLLSALIDGDRSDTAFFMLGTEARAARPATDWRAVLMRVEAKLNMLPGERQIDRARRQISDRCRAFADRPGGIVRLNVPTGGGKTLASLRYALAHAARWGKKRIIFTAPLLTILEQNSAVIREYVQDDGIILEHHSNVIRDSDDGNALDRYELLTANWDAPIVVTTMVQLLNTVFAGGSSSIRRFHSLCDSILVIDEVQTIPLKLLSLFNLAVRFLSGMCGATVVLCSATQPGLERLPYPLFPVPEEMVPYDPALWAVFKRTQLCDAGTFRLDEVPAFAEKVLADVDSLLIVCNKKAEAERLYQGLEKPGTRCFHLSASMCVAHRRDVLCRLYDSLKETHEKVVCVSTQVIEAGVDISFGSVIRLTAGMDHVVQAAGRCNRNAESESPAPVYVLTVADESLRSLAEIKRGKDASIALLDRFRKTPVVFADDLASPAAIDFYYQRLYAGLAKGSTEYPLDGDTLLDLLSLNPRHYKEDDSFYFRQAFKTAGERFQVLDEGGTDVIVPYGDGESLIAQLRADDAGQDLSRLKGLLESAKPYTVPIYEGQLKQLEKVHGVQWLLGGSVAVLDREHYDDKVGVTMDRQNFDYLEV